MRLLHHLHEADSKMEDDAEKAEKDSPEEKAKKSAEEQEKAVERFTKMILAAVKPEMLNMVVQQVAPMYVLWGDDWLQSLDDALKEIVSDKLRNEFIKIVKNVSIRFHHIKREGGKAKDDEKDIAKQNENPDKKDKDKEEKK